MKAARKAASDGTDRDQAEEICVFEPATSTITPHHGNAPETTHVRWRRLVRGALPLVAVGLLVTACGSTKAAQPPSTTAKTKCTSSAPGGVLSTACDTQTAAATLTGAGAN